MISWFLIVENQWLIKGFEYWQSELCVISDKEIWINVGFHLPLVCDKASFQKTLACSGHIYAQKFN